MSKNMYSALVTIEIDKDVDPEDILDQITQRILDMPEKGLKDIFFTKPTNKPFMFGHI